MLQRGAPPSTLQGEAAPGVVLTLPDAMDQNLHPAVDAPPLGPVQNTLLQKRSRELVSHCSFIIYCFLYNFFKLGLRFELNNSVALIWPFGPFAYVCWRFSTDYHHLLA